MSEPTPRASSEPHALSDQARGSERGQSPNAKFAIGLARAFGGAVIFSLPLMMTMEMWYLGSAVSDFRLALFVVLNIPLLVALSHYIGFEDTFGFKDDLLDAFVAYGVGFVAASAALLLFGVVHSAKPLDHLVGQVAIQAVPGSIGAMLAQSEFGGQQKKKDRSKRYGDELFIMAVGALFLALNIAPTEEVVLIAQQMSDWHTLVLALVSLLIMPAFVFSLEFTGQVAIPEDTPFWNVFVRFTVAGYALALIMSLYVLWTFGRSDGLTLHQLVTAVIVLGFPAAVGAAAARLII